MARKKKSGSVVLDRKVKDTGAQSALDKLREAGRPTEAERRMLKGGKRIKGSESQVIRLRDGSVVTKG